MADDASPPLITMKNYRVCRIDPTRVTAIEATFAAIDAITGDPLCTQCPAPRRGLYAWTCPACQAACTHHIVIGYQRYGDGSIHPCSRCLDCGLGGLTPIAKGDRVWSVCVRDLLAAFASEPCARCGGTAGTQLHHWAPRAIFEDADLWPMAYLCPPCHRTWHQAMRNAKGFTLQVKAAAA